MPHWRVPPCPALLIPARSSSTAIRVFGPGRVPASSRLAFAEEVAPVGGQLLVSIDPARRPADLDPLDPGRRPQAEVEPRVAGRLVAAAAEPPRRLPGSAGLDRDPGATASRFEVRALRGGTSAKWPRRRSGCGSRPGARSGQTIRQSSRPSLSRSPTARPAPERLVWNGGPARSDDVDQPAVGPARARAARASRRGTRAGSRRRGRWP